MCMRVSGRICVAQHQRNSGRARAPGRRHTVSTCVWCFLCASFIKRVPEMEERERDDPWMGSRREMKKREERAERSWGGRGSPHYVLLKPERLLMVSLSLGSCLSYSSLTFCFIQTSCYLTFSLRLSLLLSLGGCNSI